MSIGNSQSFKYKAIPVGKTADAAAGNSFVKNKILVVSLKFLSNFWGSLEMPLINCKALELNSIKVLEILQKFRITDAKLHARIVTLSTKDNVNLTKQLSDEFKGSVCWDNYQTIPAKGINNETNIYKFLSAPFQGVKRSFVLAYATTANDNEAGIKNSRKYFLSRGKIENYNVLIDGRNFYDQPINDLIKQYDEVRKVSTRQGDDYTTGCLSDYAYVKDNYRLTAEDLSKRKSLNADPKAIQQIMFQRKTVQKLRLYTILEKSKERAL